MSPNEAKDPKAPFHHDIFWKYYLMKMIRPFLKIHYTAEQYDRIDFTKKIVFLDKEVQEITDAKRTRSVADTLIQLTLKDQSTQLIYLNIEIQAQYQGDIGKRLFKYFKGLSLKYKTDQIETILFMIKLFGSFGD